jgi:type II secretion system protein N
MLRVAPYLVYGAVVFGVCLYVTFPYGLLAQYGAEHWAPPGVHVRASGVKSLFPPGVQARRVAVSLEAAAGRQDIVQAAGLRVRPSWLALATGRPQAAFSAALYGGRIQGYVSRQRDKDAPLWDVQVTFAALEIDRHPLARRHEETFLRGRLSGSVAARLDEHGRLHGASVELNAAGLMFAGRVLQLPLQRDIACATAQSEAQAATAGNGNVSLACTGDDLDIAATGTLTWQGSVRNAALDLRWQVRSQSLYRQEVNFLGALVGQEPDEAGELSFRLYGPWQRLRTSG